MLTAPTAPTPAQVLDVVSIGRPVESLTEAVDELATLDTAVRREQAARAAAARRADLELYADLVAERFPLAGRPSVTRLVAEDELYTTLALLAVA